jgi:MinD-like ATPase involved in chromosome partitioning or flagellar assembly
MRRCRRVSLPVITAADGAGWESALLAELGTLARGSGRLTVTRRCVDVVELVAVAASGQARAALVDAQLRRLDADVVDRLTAAGVAVVGVTAPGSAGDAARLTECGISFSVPADAPAAVLLTVIDLAIAELAGPTRQLSFADPAEASATSQADVNAARTAEQPSEPVVRAHRGSVVAVWGPTGAPGRTLLAANLADELARAGKSALLIDADVYGGVVASMFGLLDESAGLIAACRQAQRRKLDLVALSGLCWQINASLRVLTGIGRADRWPELRPTALESVIEVARELAEFTVLDLGFGLETDEELSFDTAAPRRNGATLAGLAAADLVLVIGAADPIGMQRVIRGLDELRSTEIQTPTWVVLNRVRGAATPGSAPSQLQETLGRFAGRTATVMLPHDLDAADRALGAGKTLAEAAPNSPLRRAISELARSLAGEPAPQRGRRRR